MCMNCVQHNNDQSIFEFMKQMLIPFLLLTSSVCAQTNTEEVVRRVADNIIKTTSFRFVNNKTGEKFESTKGKDTSFQVRAESKFNRWQYVNGVLTVGMLRL